MSGMRHVPGEMCAEGQPDHSTAPPSRSAPDAMAGTFRRWLLEQHKVAYDPEQGEVTVPVTDSMRCLKVEAFLKPDQRTPLRSCCR